MSPAPPHLVVVSFLKSFHPPIFHAFVIGPDTSSLIQASEWTCYLSGCGFDYVAKSIVSLCGILESERQWKAVVAVRRPTSELSPQVDQRLPRWETLTAL